MGGKSKKQTVGYKYYLGMHLVMCHGPIDFISRVTVDDRVAWSGKSKGGQISINQPSLFGGDGREGGVSGTIDIEMGDAAQGQNSYLVSKLGGLVPAFRGVVGAVFRQCYLGNNPYLKPWRFRGQRVSKLTDGSPQWNNGKAPIAHELEGDASFYFLLDRSASLSASEFQSIKNAAKSGLDLIAAYLAKNPENRVDVAVRFYSDGSVADERVDVDAGDIAALKAFIDGAGIVTGGDVSSAFGFINTWFQATASEDFEKRAVIFVTDTNSEDGMTTASSSGGTAYTMINSLPPFSSAPVSIYAINYNSSTTTWTGLMDNTPEDGVPIIAGSDDSGLTDAVNSALSSQFIDLNGVHIIRECLTDNVWGMGYLTSDIDEDSFAAAATTIFNERLGVSLLWDRQIKLEEFIDEVKKHIDAAVYVSRKTGKYVIKLIRNDYDPDTLLTLGDDQQNIIRIEDPNRPSFGELVNSVTVNYWDQKTGKDASLTVTDTALVQMQGVVINTTLQYPGFTSARNATIAAQRDLKTLSSPALSCVIYANSEAKDLNVGDVFKLNWAPWGLQGVVMRVADIAYGDGRSNVVKISCTQDTYDTNTTVVISPSTNDWQDPSAPPSAVDVQMVDEAPYLELAQVLGQTAVDTELAANPEAGYVLAAISRAGSAINARMWTDDGDGYEVIDVIDFSPSCVTVDDITKTDTVINITDASDLDVVELGTFCQIGEGLAKEMCRIDAIDEVAGTITLGRGVMDTVPHEHPAASRIWFWDLYSGADPTEYVDGETVNVKVTTVSGAGELDLADAIEDSVTLYSRAVRPYPPGNLTLNGDSYVPEQQYSGVVYVAWAHRDRTQQTGGTLYDHFFGDIGPEVGTTYNLRGYQGGILVDEFLDIDANTFEWIPSNSGEWLVELESERDGHVSLQQAYHTFLFGDLFPYTMPLVNGDFETGTTAGWSNINGVGGNVGIYSGDPWGGGGAYYAVMSTNQSFTSWGQTVEIDAAYHADVDAGGVWIELSLNQNAFNEDGDRFAPCFEFLDATDTWIGGRTHEMQDPDILGGLSAWTYRGFVPPGARKLRLRMNGNRVGGTEMSVYLDKFEVKLDLFPGKVTQLAGNNGSDHATWTIVSGGLGYQGNLNTGWGIYELDGYFGGSVASSEAYKDFAFTGDDLTAVSEGRAALQLSLWLLNENSDDRVRVVFEWYDGTDTLIETAWQSGTATVNYGTVGSIFDIPGIKVPNSAAKLRIRQYWTRADGTVNDACISRMNAQLFALDPVTPSGTPTSTKWRVRAFATYNAQGLANKNSNIWRCGFQAIEMRETASGANACTGGTGTVSSRWQNSAAFNAAAALDADSTTESLSAGGQWPYWWQYEFASAINIAEVALTARDVNMGDEPALFLLEYFDGTDWVAHDLFNVDGAWTANEQKIFTVGA